MSDPISRTSGPIAFIAELESAIDGLKTGRVVGMNAHYEPNGIGRVSVTTADGSTVEVDPDLVTSTTAPGHGAWRRNRQ